MSFYMFYLGIKNRESHKNLLVIDVIYTETMWSQDKTGIPGTRQSAV